MINPKAFEAILKNLGTVYAVVRKVRGDKDGFAPGTLVRMSHRCRVQMNVRSPEHVEEFRHCIGHVEGFCDQGTPYEDRTMYDVRWHIKGGGTLRYAYPPHYLERVK